MPNESEKQYLNMLQTILNEGERIPNRTGVDALTIPHMMLSHDMKDGFPLFTTKKMAFKTMKVELEGFINGITDKRWYQERGCRIWDEWSHIPKDMKFENDEERKKYQLESNDLGPIYGAQWRRFGQESHSNSTRLAPESAPHDQLKTIVDTLKKNPSDRRMLCSAWNPLLLSEQALPPCHVLWHLTVVKDKLNLCFMMRSVDFLLGAPFNISSYALLLHLLAKESGLKEGKVTGFLSNVHIYVNHIDAVKEQLSRTPYEYPKIETSPFTSIFNWTHKDSKVIDYNHYDAIKAPIAI